MGEKKKAEILKGHVVHRYVRKNLTRNPEKEPYYVYACIISGCFHYIRTDLALGKRSICNRCGKEFVMDNRSVKEQKPHCSKCVKRNSKRKQQFDLANNLLAELGLGSISEDEDDDG